MLLTAKITKPNYSPGIIERARLYRHLDRWQDFRAVVIHAPAGYGKSTLVSRWIDISDLGRRSAWFSLEEEDSSPYQFIQYLAAALDSCHPGLLAAVQPVLKDRQGSAQRALMRLLAVLEEDSFPPSPTTGQHLLLVLDDLQRIESVEVEALIHRVLEYGPHNLHLLLLARQRTELSLARLYAHGAILALNKQDLRFTEEEVQAYLWEQGFPTASSADAAQLTLRSEGWVSGLHLAILSLRVRGSVPELVRALQGSREWLAEFLADEVLDRQQPELRLFLLQTAILDGFNGSLCAAVTGTDDASAKLAEIARADLFLIEMGIGEGWFRYHHLFQELLKQRLVAKLDAGAIAELHRRAAAWLAREGQIHAAVYHLLAGGFVEKAADLMESRMRKLLVRDLNEARRLFGILPQHIWQQRPQLLLDRCFLAVLLDDRQALRHVQQAAEILQAQGVAAENAPALHGEWLVFSSGAHLIAADFEAAARFARQAQLYLDDLDDLTAGVLQFIQTHLRHFDGDQAATLQLAERALAAFDRADFMIGTIAVQRQLARWNINSGNGQEATRRFHALLDNPPRDRPEIFHDLTYAYLFAAENSYWQNDIDQARVYQQASLALARQLQDDVLMHCVRTMGAVYHADDAENSAPNRPFDPQIEQAASRIPLELLIDLDIRRLTAAGNAEDAWAVAQKIGIDRANTPDVYQQRSLIPYLRATIARGLDLPAVTPLLAGALTYHAGIGNRFNQLQLLALTAWQQLKAHGTQTAAAALAEAAHLAQETGYVRVLLDIPELAALLPEGNQTRNLASPQKITKGAAIDLTAREQQVLQLLASGLTYQQIGDEMMVSINTVRTHVRHIYEKLSVKKRDQAIAAARRLGLLND